MTNELQESMLQICIRIQI